MHTQNLKNLLQKIGYKVTYDFLPRDRNNCVLTYEQGLEIVTKFIENGQAQLQQLLQQNKLVTYDDIFDLLLNKRMNLQPLPNKEFDHIFKVIFSSKNRGGDLLK